MKVNKIIQTTVDEELEITGATLLSVEEAEMLPIRLRKYDLWWWLRSPGYDRYIAAYGYYDGAINHGGYDVYYVSGVRPALKISNLKSSNMKIGDVFTLFYRRFEIVSESLAFCLEDIGRQCFRKDRGAEDANDYEKSDIKKYIDKWFKEAKEYAEIH